MGWRGEVGGNRWPGHGTTLTITADCGCRQQKFIFSGSGGWTSEIQDFNIWVLGVTGQPVAAAST